MEGEIEEGKSTGKWVEWFADGTKSFEGSRKRSITKEKWTVWHERVQKSLESQD